MKDEVIYFDEFHFNGALSHVHGYCDKLNELAAMLWTYGIDVDKTAMQEYLSGAETIALKIKAWQDNQLSELPELIRKQYSSQTINLTNENRILRDLETTAKFFSESLSNAGRPHRRPLELCNYVEGQRYTVDEDALKKHFTVVATPEISVLVKQAEAIETAWKRLEADCTKHGLRICGTMNSVFLQNHDRTELSFNRGATCFFT